MNDRVIFTELPVTRKYFVRDLHAHSLFRTMAKERNLHFYRKKGQSKTTFMIEGPAAELDMFWEEFRSEYEILNLLLRRQAQRYVGNRKPSEGAEDESC